ncbi:MAG: hypothetical protein JRN32_03190 [Nitrososphaerota archaeon]|nr:hypothetical protein [Nitrososphaerota archaeon]MDG7045805.1 hypothetical protein [Nitrososphaerota archaeon]
MKAATATAAAAKDKGITALHIYVRGEGGSCQTNIGLTS